MRSGGENCARAHVRLGKCSSPKSLGPNATGVGFFLESVFDIRGRFVGPPPNNRRCQIFLRRKVIMDARALDAHILRDLAKAETTEAASLNAALGSIHDCCFHIGHAVSPCPALAKLLLLIDSAICRYSRQAF